MNGPLAVCHFRIAFSDLALLKRVLAELAENVEGPVVLRKGQIPEEGARVELELQTTLEQIELAFLVLERPGVTIQFYEVQQLRPPAKPYCIFSPAPVCQ
jgi:hypothetical protein